jgi:tetratricopeptide (TPR) repeat protein
MTAGRWDKIKNIFDSALETTPENRAAFVEHACMDDPAMRDEVSRLLAEFEKTETFLGQPLARLSHAISSGELIGGRYRVVQLLGRGGMGEVFEVQDQLLNETVALKTLRADLCHDASLIRRFQTEIQLARKVTHANVCRVFEVGVHEFSDKSRPPLHFFTMQLLRGETLAARIRRAGRLPRDEAFPLIAQMAEGLQAAHDQGIIHRDFKSANVIITGGRAVITDFGLAGLEPGRAPAASAGSVSTGTRLAGTVAYMSPEQMSGGQIGPASDIYSLGIVLFEMATGKLPFEDHHIIQSAMQRVQGQTPSASALAPDIDPRWESAIRRCLEIEPARRFQAASELAELFGDRTWRLPRVYWTRRKWAGVAAAAAVPVAAGAGYWTWSRRPYEPKPEALIWYERGVEALRASTHEAARRSLEKAVATDPRYAPASAYLAAAYNDLDASERAKETMLKAVSESQDERLSETDAVRVKALQYVISRDFDRAQPLFEQLLSAAPDRAKPGAYVDLAWLAWKRQDTPAMISPLEHALQLNSGYAGAKLWLAFAVDRQGKSDVAQKLFEEAETLFNTASDYDGVVETLLQRAISLGRANRTSEAIALIDRGMAVATSTGDLHHQIQLQLALALAFRNTGETAKSRDLAERAVKLAVENKMDQPAAIGLLDLGNACLQRDEPEQAERYFQQGLEMASRARALFSEARARLSLGAFCDKYDRPREVSKYVQPAVAFFRAAGYRRESMQAMLVLGGAQETLAQFEEAEKTQREAIRLADQIHDDEQSGTAHLYLSSVMAKSSRWPESMAEKGLALGIFGDMRGGYRAAYTLVARARLGAQMGQFEKASADLAQARARVEKMEGKQAQLRARLALGEAEIASYQTRWVDALRFARQAAALNGGTVENIEAEMLTGVAMIHLGSAQPGLTACNHAIRASEEKSQPFLAARSKLSFAETLWGKNLAGAARPLAQDALLFFQPRRIWDSVWRCQRILTSHSSGALDEVKRLWPADIVRSYLQRPDIKEFALP